MTQEAGQPFGIMDVGLSAGDVLGMPGVDEDNFDMTLRNVVHRPPVNAGALDCRNRAVIFTVSISEIEESFRKGGKLFYFASDLSDFGGIKDTGGHSVLVDIEPAANRVDNRNNLGIIGHGRSPGD